MKRADPSAHALFRVYGDEQFAARLEDERRGCVHQLRQCVLASRQPNSPRAQAARRGARARLPLSRRGSGSRSLACELRLRRFVGAAVVAGAVGGAYGKAAADHPSRPGHPLSVAVAQAQARVTARSGSAPSGPRGAMSVSPRSLAYVSPLARAAVSARAIARSREARKAAPARLGRAVRLSAQASESARLRTASAAVVAAPAVVGRYPPVAVNGARPSGSTATSAGGAEFGFER